MPAVSNQVGLITQTNPHKIVRHANGHKSAFIMHLNSDILNARYSNDELDHKQNAVL